MNCKIRFITFCFLVVICQSCGRYQIITHMSDEELEWLTNRYVGETMYFQSQSGITDTITVTAIKINNSTDSIDWNYYTIGGSGVYNAGGRVSFSIRDREYWNSLYLYKDTNELIKFGADFLDFWIPAVHIVDTCMQIDSMPFEDILFFDERRIFNKYNLPNPITSFAWSKKYGLVLYTFEDGTVFTRTDLEGQLKDF